MSVTQTSDNTALLRADINKPIRTISHGEGMFLWDTDGRRYLDAASGAVAAAVGHAHPHVLQALRRQASKVTHVYRGAFTSEAAEKLAHMLIDRAPAGIERVQFANSGSEAVEIALKIAVQYWQERGRPEKWRAISRRHSYHGNTLGALSLSGHIRRERFDKLLHAFPAVTAPDPQDARSVEDFERAIREYGADTIAAIVIEPIIGASSPALAPPHEYHQRLRDICDEHDILLIADEVLSGTYRSGPFLAIEASGVTPDLITLGKGLGGGYMPLSAVLLSDRVVRGFEQGSGKLDTGGHTYASNPLAAAVGVAVLETIDEEDLGRNSADRGRELLAGLQRLQAAHPVVTSARGTGLLCGLVLDDGLVPHASKKLVEAAAQLGLIIYLAGDGEIDGVLVTPPLIVSSEHIEELLALLDNALTAIEA